jgi:hypothetical protein
VTEVPAGILLERTAADVALALARSVAEVVTTLVGELAAAA